MDWKRQFSGDGSSSKEEPNDEEWMNVTYQVYDLIDSKEPFFIITKLKRLVKLVQGRWKVMRKDLSYPFNTIPCPLVFVEQIPVKSQHLKEMYDEILAKGGRGLCLRIPIVNMASSVRQSSNLLKVKPNFDAEKPL